VKKITLAMIIMLLLFQTGYASPLNDFSQGSTAVDLARSVSHLRYGGSGWDFSVTTGLGNEWAVKYRQINYDTEYSGDSYAAKSGDLQLIYKADDAIQFYLGYSRTMGYDKTIGQGIADKNALVVGTIATHALSKRTKLYAILGGGENVTNIEFGLSFQLKPGVELTPSYRHLTVEKVGPTRIKENYRNFNLGLTFVF